MKKILLAVLLVILVIAVAVVIVLQTYGNSEDVPFTYKIVNEGKKTIAITETKEITKVLPTV